GLKLSSSELQFARMEVLKTIIDREVLFQRAEREGLLHTEERVTAAINEQKRQTGMDDYQFSKTLTQKRMTLNELRMEAAKDLAIKALQDKYTRGIRISDRDVEEYY